jgi:hypothetical protein
VSAFIFSIPSAYAAGVVICEMMVSYSRTKPLRFVQPVVRPGGLGALKISNRSFRERLEKYRHAVLPLLFPDHCQSLDIGKVLDR